MTESDTDIYKNPRTQTEASRGGSGVPPRKTAVGYAGSDDHDKEKALREEHQKRDQLIRQKLSKLAAEGTSSSHPEHLLKKLKSDKVTSLLAWLANPGPLKLQFALFALREIQFGHNTVCDEFHSARPELPINRATPVGICSLGPVHRQKNFRFSGTIYSATLKENDADRPKDGPADSRTKLPAPIPQDGAKVLREAHIMSLNRQGDYSTSNLDCCYEIHPETQGLIRLFLAGDGDPDRPTVITSHKSAQNRPVDFQIWYEGLGVIRLQGITAFVYAPNATVEIPLNQIFKGAIIANRIVGQGNNKFSFDISLMNATFNGRVATTSS